MPISDVPQGTTSTIVNTTNWNAIVNAINAIIDVIGSSGVVCLLADGSIPLTANWDIGDTIHLVTDTVMARDAAGLELFEDGGKGLFVVDSTGFVGAGTVTPYGVFEARKDLALAGDGANVTRIIANNANATGICAFALYCGANEQGRLQYNNTSPNIFFTTITAIPVYLGTQDIVRLAIKSSGEVGINTITQSAKLASNGGVHVGGDSDPGDNNLLVDGNAEIDGALNHDGTTVGFYGTAPTTKPAVTGAKVHAVETSILAALVALGLVTDSTT